MLGSGSPLVSNLSGVGSEHEEEGMKDTETDVGEMVEAGRGV